MIIGNGQINMNSEFGTCIFNICSDITIRNIIEVGSWNGQGTTTCVMNGILNKPKSILYSIEANSTMYNRAINFWKKYDTKNKLVLINGTLHNKIADLNELNILYNNNIPYYNEHYLPEKQMIENSSIINIENIQDVDVIILDGGEYTTLEDFNILIQKHPKYICLDDTNVYKCKNIRYTLLNDNNWVIYYENLNDRNGWSILKKNG
jgi:hypothetical protein